MEYIHTCISPSPLYAGQARQPSRAGAGGGGAGRRPRAPPAETRRGARRKSTMAVSAAAMPDAEYRKLASKPIIKVRSWGFNWGRENLYPTL